MTLKSPLLEVKQASLNSSTIAPSENQPKSPPLIADPLSSEIFCAKSPKSVPD